jgi:hypothetical protein
MGGPMGGLMGGPMGSPMGGPMSGAGMGGGGMGMGMGGAVSDIRAKHDIVLFGHLDNGLGFYRFSYNGSDKAYVGVMAQEVQAVSPMRSCAAATAICASITTGTVCTCRPGKTGSAQARRFRQPPCYCGGDAGPLSARPDVIRRSSGYEKMQRAAARAALPFGVKEDQSLARST